MKDILGALGNFLKEIFLIFLLRYWAKQAFRSPWLRAWLKDFFGATFFSL